MMLVVQLEGAKEEGGFGAKGGAGLPEGVETAAVARAA